MGLIAKLVSFGRTVKNGIYYADAKCAPGNGANVIAHNFSAAGDDSKPLPSDYVLLVKLPQTGRYAVAGYSDPNNAGESDSGAKRIYARSSDGEIIAEIDLRNSGEIILDGAVNVLDGATGVATSSSTVTFINGIAVSIE